MTRGESLARAKIHVNFALVCDCEAYWAAAALRARPSHLQLERVRCAGGGALAAQPDAALTCAAPRLCASGCACGTRPRAAPPPRAPRLALHVRCANRTRLPRLPAAAADYAQALQLANNNISHVSVDDLPPHLLVSQSNLHECQIFPRIFQKTICSQQFRNRDSYMDKITYLLTTNLLPHPNMA